MRNDSDGTSAAPGPGSPTERPRAPHPAEAWILVTVAVIAAIGIAAAAPRAVNGDPTVEIVSQMLLVLAVVVGTVVVVRRARPRRTGFLLALLTGTFLAAGAMVLLNANAFGPLGAVLDQSFRTAQITRFAHEWRLGDFAYRDLPAYYPPLYFWVLGRVADLLGIPPWHMIKIGVIVVAAAVPLVTWALWRRVAGDTAAAAVAVGASLVYQDWYAPYLWIAVVVVVPWWLHWGLGVGRDPERRWGRADLAVGVALGAFVVTTYWFLLAIVAVHLVVLLAVRTPARRHGLEVLPRSWRGPGVVLVGTFVVTAVYWVPYTVSYVTTGGARLMQNRYFTAAEITLPTPFLDFDLRGMVLLAGLLYLAATCTRRMLSLHLLGLVGAAYLVCVLSYLGFAADTPLKPERTHALIIDVLAAGAALGVVHAVSWARAGAGWLRVEGPTITAVALVVGIALVIGFGQTAVRSMPYLEEQRAARYPSALLDDFEQATRGRYDDSVVLTDVTDLNTFLPVYVFNTSDAHYAHPAALFDDRADLLTELAGEPDPEAFALMMLHNRYDPVDYVALRQDGDALTYSWLADAFPLGVANRSVEFPTESFSDDAFVRLPSGELTMYRLDRDQDPRKRLRDCPARPDQPKCSVLRGLLDRYSEHLDESTRTLATRWQRAR